MNSSDFEKSGDFAKANAFYPLLDLVGEHLASRGHLRNIRLAWHCHLTELTAITAKALAVAGCQASLSECNPATSEPESIEYMRGLGFKVFTGPSSVSKVIEDRPAIITDTGFDLLTYWFAQEAAVSTSKSKPLLGACEITSSGITRLRALNSVPIPIININDGEIKSYVENFHGVGDGVLDTLKLVTGRTYQGERVCVVGYGRVGAGVAHYLHRSGVHVTVVEPNPVRQLVAHFDGFPISSLQEAISASSLMVTATGQKDLLTIEDWRHARDGLLVLNVGHWREELGLAELEKSCESKQSVGKHVDQFQLNSHDGKPLRIRVVANGDPCNIALHTGSIEPTLIHLAVELLAIEYIVTHQQSLKPGEIRIPDEVESVAAQLALRVSV